MIANKSTQMSVEIFDSALLSPTEQSFFSDDCPQPQHCSEITPLGSELGSEEWFHEFDDIICDFGLDLNNEPELSLEEMTKEDDIQTKADELFDYLESTPFLSPLSIEPSSPQSVYDNSGVNTTAISLLEELLSTNSSDSECLSDQYFDSEPNLHSISEVSKDSKNDEILPPETKSIPKRQYKRKAQQTNEKSKPNKKSKTTINEKKERKRNQNKSAANRYRQKKRAESDDIEEQRNHFLKINSELKAKLEKLQMEFKVIYPLAKAAFSKSDPLKALQLEMVDSEVQTHNLLD